MAKTTKNKEDKALEKKDSKSVQEGLKTSKKTDSNTKVAKKTTSVKVSSKKVKKTENKVSKKGTQSKTSASSSASTKVVKSKTTKASAELKEQKLSDTYAIVKKGNSQFFLEQGALLEIPRINVPEGKEYKFEEVLLASVKNELKVGTPVINGAYVKVFVIKQLKGEKQRGFKYKAKSRYRKTWGYRTPKTRIRVIEIKA